MNLCELERIDARRKTRDYILKTERSQFEKGDYCHGFMNNNTLFIMTMELFIETGNPSERAIARELFERSLHYQLQYGGFNW